MSLATSMNGDAYRFLRPNGTWFFIPGLPGLRPGLLSAALRGGASARLLLPGAIAPTTMNSVQVSRRRTFRRAK